MALDLSQLDLVAQDERRRVGEQYGNIGNQLQTSFSRRGLGRSGFAEEGMAALGGQEAGAYAAVNANDAARKQQYQQEQDQITAQQEAQRQQQEQIRNANRRHRKRRWLGGALSALAIAGAFFTGGATLAALPATLSMTTG